MLILFKTADAFCLMENMILQATELGIASSIVSRGYETFENRDGSIFPIVENSPGIWYNSSNQNHV